MPTEAESTDAATRVCTDCRGNGWKEVRYSTTPHGVFQETCRRCNGWGHIDIALSLANPSPTDRGGM